MNIKRLKREKYLGYILIIILLSCIIINIILNKSWDLFLVPIAGIAFVIYGLIELDKTKKVLLQLEIEKKDFKKKLKGEILNELGTLDKI